MVSGTSVITSPARVVPRTVISPARERGERGTIWTWPDILKKAGIGNHIRIDMEPDRHRAGLTVWFVIPLVVPLVGSQGRAHPRILILAPRNVCDQWQIELRENFVRSRGLGL